MKKGQIEVKIKSFDYVDGDILYVEVVDDRGEIYTGSLEKKEN